MNSNERTEAHLCQTIRKSRLRCSPPGSAVLLCCVGMPLGSALVTAIIVRWFLKKVMRPRFASWIALVAAIAVAWPVLVSGVADLRDISAQRCCQSTLHQFDIALGQYATDNGGSYPFVLTDLHPDDVSPSLFACPGVQPREIASSVAEAGPTACYIYVAGLSWENPDRIPILLCPPMNHGGKSGNVLWSDHSTRSIKKDEFDKLYGKLVADESVTLIVSELVNERSGGKYTSTWRIGVQSIGTDSEKGLTRTATNMLSGTWGPVELSEVLDLFELIAEVDLVYDTNAIQGVLIEELPPEDEWFPSLTHLLSDLGFRMDQDPTTSNTYLITKQ